MMTEPGSPPPAPPQLQAIRTIGDAQSYVDAARVLEEQGRNPVGLPRHFAPIFFLLSQSIELVLKAYLFSQGTSPREIKGADIRHNLSKLLERAQAAGFEPADDRFLEVAEWLSPYHEIHLFRYSQTGLVRVPLPSEVVEIVAATIAGVECTVRANYFALRGRA